MEFSVKTGQPEKQRSPCIVVFVFENRTLTQTAKQLDSASNKTLSALLRKGDLDGKLGQTALLYELPNLASDRVLLVGCGPEPLNDKDFRECVRKMVNTLSQTGTTEFICYMDDLNVKSRDLHWKIKYAVEIIQEIFYSFEKFKTKKEKEKKSELRRVTFMVSSKKEMAVGEQAIREGEAISKGVILAKDLGNTPPNICTPIFLAKEAETLAAKFPHISVAVLNEKEIAALKMGSFLSVAKGSKNPPRFITFEYQGRKDKQKPIVFVGKGITFDTGGNSLKSAAGMIGMKYDMCGAAAVFGIIQVAAELELPLNIVGVIPSAENMPGNEASRPEDIVTSLSGLTIEILNTDAEGRLILCDALTYCERFNPEVVIDIATLTGACVQALGYHASGLFSNYPPLASALKNAGNTSVDRCWELPLWDEYQEALTSPFADIANIGNPPEGGAILGACFLSRFTQKYHWAHLDIAGTARTASSGKDRGATGRPVPLLAQYLLDLCENPKDIPKK